MVILFDSFNLPDDIYKVVFATEQQELVGRLLVNHMFDNGGEITKTEMGLFANQLHEGSIVIKEKRGVLDKDIKLSYNKRQFYDRILTPMKALGIIDYDLYKKTYRISERFNKVMIKVGLIWLKEIRKQQEARGK
ncbi:MAG: hypothetical protein ABIG93_02210 [archaeon]|nr:hypothetical protein [Nanoarchaeota archaeon]